MDEYRSRAESFGAAAERYDRSRPSYPEELFDEILGPDRADPTGRADPTHRADPAGLADPTDRAEPTHRAGPTGRADPAGLDVLDVGCGTGIAARQMAARGARVLGVEVDARMAGLARRLGTMVEVGRFEEWDPAGRTFDRVTAAQAWHWVDPLAGAAKAAGLLRPGGRLCIFWNIGHPTAEVDRAMDRVYERLAPDADGHSVVTGLATGDRYEAQRKAIEETPGLGPPEERHFPWRRTYTRDEWLDQLPTHSDHAAMEPARLERVLRAIGEVIDRFGGSFVMEYDTLLLVSTRESTPDQPGG